MKGLFGKGQPSGKKIHALAEQMPHPEAFKKEVYGCLFCNFTKLPLAYQKFALSLFYLKDDSFLKYLVTDTLLSAIRLQVKSPSTFKKKFSHWNKTLMFDKTSNTKLAATLLLVFDIGLSSTTLGEYIRKNFPEEEIFPILKKHLKSQQKKEVKNKQIK